VIWSPASPVILNNMTREPTDDRKQGSILNVMLKVTCGLFVYVASYFPISVIFLWLRLPERLPPWALLPFQIFYWPVQSMIRAAGSSDSYFDFINSIARTLP
jgi:hypothetical protein